MAEFGQTDLGGVQDPFRPQGAVQKDAGLVQGVLGAAGNLLEGLGKSRLEGAKERQVQGVIGRFQQEQLKYADAVDQGLISSQEARMRMRSSFARFSADNPALIGDLTKVQKDIVTTSGLGKVTVEGTAQEQAMLDLEKEGIGKGLISPSASREERAIQTLEYAEIKRVSDEIAREQAKASLQSTQLGIESSTVALRQSRLREASMANTTKLAQAFTPSFQRDMADLVANLKQGTMSQQEAIQAAQDRWNAVQSTISGISDPAGAAHAQHAVFHMKSMYETTLQRLKGELTDELMADKNNRVVAIATSKLLEEPKMAFMAATNKLLPNSDILGVISNMDRDVLTYYNNLAQATEDSPGPNPYNRGSETTPQEKQLVFDSLGSNIDLMLKGELDKPAQQQLDNSINTYIRSIDAYKDFADNPKDFNQAMKFLSSDKFGRYASKKGGVPKEAAKAASEVIKAKYERVVIPKLREEYEQVVLPAFRPIQPTGTAPESRDLTKFVRPVFSGSGVTFVAQQGLDQGALSASQASISRLNKVLAPVINQMIRAAAHLDGNQNYKKVYDDNYAGIFGTPQQ